MRGSPKKEKLKEILTRERLQRGLSQQAVADAVGASLRNYQRWEQGKVFPQSHYVEKLREFFGPCIDEATMPRVSEQTLQYQPILSDQQDITVPSGVKEDNPSTSSQERPGYQHSSSPKRDEDLQREQKKIPTEPPLNPLSRLNRRQRSRSVILLALLIVVVLIGLVSLRGLLTPPGNTIMTPSATVSFDFETGTQHWVTSEGQFKLANLSVTTKPVHSGKQALQLTTELLGDANPDYTASKEVYRHTEATAYFDVAIPKGFSSPGPYNLTGKRISCFVYLPEGLAPEGSPQAFIRLLVKDTKFANAFSKEVMIDSSNVERWIQLSFVVDVGAQYADVNFVSTKVNTIGVRIETNKGSTLHYKGSLYIDDCTIQHP